MMLERWGPLFFGLWKRGSVWKPALLLAMALFFGVTLLYPREAPVSVSLFDDGKVKDSSPFAIPFAEGPGAEPQEFRAKFWLHFDETALPGQFSGVFRGIDLVFVTFGGAPFEGDLLVRAAQENGAHCLWRLGKVKIEDNQTKRIDLAREECLGPLRLAAGAPRVSVEFLLTLPQKNDGTSPRIGIWGRQVPTEWVPRGAALVLDEDVTHSGQQLSASGSQVAAIGAVHLGPEGALWSPLARLCWLWGLPVAATWPLFALLSLLLICGCWCVAKNWGSASGQLTRDLKRIEPDPERMGSLRTRPFVLRAALGALCFGGFWGLLIPPLQAPDEPDHLLTYINNFESADPAPLAAYAKAIHFERIKFRPSERFSSGHVLEPYPMAWAGHVNHTQLEKRSPATQVYWSALRSILPAYGVPIAAFGWGVDQPTSSVGIWLLAFRLANVAFLAICVSLLAAALTFGGGSLQRGCYVEGALLAVTLAGIPAVAFFAMMVSTYTVLISGYLFLACAVAGLAGKLISCTNGNLERSSFSVRSAIQMALCVLCGLTLALTGGSAGIALAAVAGAMVLLLMVQDSPMVLRLLVSGLFIFGAPLFFSVLTRLTPSFDTVRNPHLQNAMVWLLWVSPALWLGYSLLVPLVFRKVFTGISPAGLMVGRWLFIGGGFLLMYVTLARPIDGLHNIETQRDLSAGLYIWDAVKTFLFTSVFGAPEYYTAETFWSGFGWLEKVWSPAVTKFLQLIVFAGVVRWVVGAKSRFIALLCTGSILAGVALLAFGYHQVHYNLHGRYLIGIYFFMMALAVPGWRLLFADVGRLREASAEIRGSSDEVQLRGHTERVQSLVFSGFMGLNLFAVEFIITRYF